MRALRDHVGKDKITWNIVEKGMRRDVDLRNELDRGKIETLFCRQDSEKEYVRFDTSAKSLYAFHLNLDI